MQAVRRVKCFFWRIIANKRVSITHFPCDIPKIVVKDIFYLTRANLKMRSFSHHLDVDECTLNSHDCDANANCSNTPGSFTCECDHNSHYYGNGKTCYANRKFRLSTLSFRHWFKEGMLASGSRFESWGPFPESSGN